MKERTVLYADDGMVLTDGTTYGKIIFLADGADPESFYSITEEEYNAMTEDEPAEEADYLAALDRLGVSE